MLTSPKTRGPSTTSSTSESPSESPSSLSQSSTTLSSEPSPRQLSRRIWQMRLEDDIVVFTSFTNTVKTLVKRHINTDIPLCEQKSTVRMIVSQLPLLQRYEDLWPFESYVRYYYTNVLRLSQPEIRKLLSPTACGESRYRESTRGKMSRPRSASVYESLINSQPFPRMSTPVQSTCPVSSFLLSLTPSQPNLLGVFKALGITDKATFDAFALLLRREAWQLELVRDGKITLLQSAVLSAALHKYVKSGGPNPTRIPDFVSENAVHNFLLRIAPPLPHLIPRFKGLGIIDEETLLAAAHLDGRDARLKRLAVKGIITPLEARLIGEAMADVTRGQMYARE